MKNSTLRAETEGAALTPMLTHIVIWKYRDDTDQATREEHVALLRGLASIVPGLQSLAVGFDVLRLPRSYDTGLVAVFCDRAALDAYRNLARKPTPLGVV